MLDDKDVENTTRTTKVAKEMFHNEEPDGTGVEKFALHLNGKYIHKIN